MERFVAFLARGSTEQDDQPGDLLRRSQSLVGSLRKMGSNKRAKSNEGPVARRPSVLRKAKPPTYGPGEAKLLPRKLRQPAEERQSSYSVDGVRFDMLPPPIPPRSASRNFSAPTPKQSPAFAGLGAPLRKTIFTMVLVAEHEILVCGCGHCYLNDVSKQPALTMVSRAIREEALPLYYGKNKFMVRGTYDYRENAPVWLSALSQASRNMLQHVEINTHDINSTIAMMATLGLQLAHRLPRKMHLTVMTGLQDQTIWLTFTSISNAIKALAKAMEEPTTAIYTRKLSTTLSRIWEDDEEEPDTQQMDGTADNDSISSTSTVETAILTSAVDVVGIDPSIRQDYGSYEHSKAITIEKGQVARWARGKLVTIKRATEQASAQASLVEAENMPIDENEIEIENEIENENEKEQASKPGSLHENKEAGDEAERFETTPRQTNEQTSLDGLVVKKPIVVHKRAVSSPVISRSKDSVGVGESDKVASRRKYSVGEGISGTAAGRRKYSIGLDVVRASTEQEGNKR
ncbi:hypothetical protein B0A50_05780 [Salinomyces thailandicus]|uniref:Uncharacterized protein n=1 Tax=Salinomyces thailandicus TaxID=706561 RepID=A0A4U0TV32_9PEZI|nr:hypothetical protein B0A50_05780 [Salinomyces thailandica]